MKKDKKVKDEFKKKAKKKTKKYESIQLPPGYGIGRRGGCCLPRRWPSGKNSESW